jgi:hypothetical protein
MAIVAAIVLLVGLYIVGQENGGRPGRPSPFQIEPLNALYAAAPLFGVAGLAVLLRHLTGSAAAPWAAAIIGSIGWFYWLAYKIGCCP